jgi:hypothetical protein
MIRVRVWLGLMIAAVALCGCGSSHSARPVVKPSSTTVPVQRVVIRGRATFDGAPFDARFVGAVVRAHGLVTPCQDTLPQVTKGRYQIVVLSSAAASGCGAPGSDVLLWTYMQNKQYFSTRAIAWPADGGPATFDVTFTSSAPQGAARPRTEFAGEIFDHSGRRLPDGTRVEAYIGNTLCAVASVRTEGNFTGFSISVVGPDSVAGCARGATVRFHVDGKPAVTTAVNNFRGDPSLDLTMP